MAQILDLINGMREAETPKEDASSSTVPAIGRLNQMLTGEKTPAETAPDQGPVLDEEAPVDDSRRS